MKCWTGWNRDRRKVHRGLRRQTPAETRLMLARGAGRSCLWKLSGWKRFTRQRSLAGSLWQCLYMPPICPATFIVSCAEWMCPCSHMGTMKCCGIFRDVVTLPVTSTYVWKHLGGACWISREIQLSEGELERQREKIQKGPLVVRDREHPFAEDLITDEAGVIDPQLPVLAKVSCLVDEMKMGSSYGPVEKLWAQLVLTAGPVNWEIAWTRDEVLVGSVDFRNPFVSCLIHIVVLLLVYEYYWKVAPSFVASGWLGKGSPFLQPRIQGAWRVIVGLHADVGGRHFPSGCCECCTPFCSWCHTRAISARVNCVCSGWLSVPGCCFWRVACVGRHVQGKSGKWVLAQVSGVSHFWSTSPEAMFAESVVFRLWVFGSLLDDEIYCLASEGCRTLRLDDVPVQSSPCHHHRRALDAISCWGRQQHRGGVASHRGVPQRDWSQNWRRQLSGIIHSALFGSFVIFTPSSCCFSFRSRESMAIFTSIRWPEASSACSIWYLRSVSPASCTFLMWFTLVRIHSGKVGRRFYETCGSTPSFLISGSLCESWSFHFYARVALSGHLFR